MQEILKGIEQVERVLKGLGSSRFLLVCDAAFPHLGIALPEAAACFDQFTPNPLYEDVCKGVELFNREGCDAIVAVGGGSTIDVAKCIKLYCRMDSSINYLQQTPVDTQVPLVAVPTTAGTGSESTRYAVIYYEGKKQSIAHESIIPDFAVLEPSLLKTLPPYQKKCTMLDALCQGIESMWSVNSTEESMEFSKKAIGLIKEHWHEYIVNNTGQAAESVMLAANYAGRAINITQTTAPHAMSYKLTSMYGIPHGHAVALCLPQVWKYMIEHPEGCIDPRGRGHLEQVFQYIGRIMGCGTPEEALALFRNVMTELQMPSPRSTSSEADLETLTQSVNPVRLKNNPVALPQEAIYDIYYKILNP